jgi:LysM repeat protein
MAGALALAVGTASPHHALPVKVQLEAVVTAAPGAEVSPVHAVRAQRLDQYTVKPGQYLSLIAQQQCGNASDWKGIWHASHGISNPNVVEAGQVVTLACNDSGPGWNPPPVRAKVLVRSSPSSSGGDLSYGHPNFCGDGDGDGWDVNCQTRQASSPAAIPQVHLAEASASTISPLGYSGYQRCVVTRESGGRTQVMNSSGHYGLYQFDYGTWVSGGGVGADFGRASVSEQNRVFAAVYAARGTQPWSPSDGC